MKEITKKRFYNVEKTFIKQVILNTENFIVCRYFIDNDNNIYCYCADFSKKENRYYIDESFTTNSILRDWVYSSMLVYI